MADINFDLEIDVKDAQKSLKRLERVGTATFAALGAAAATVATAFAGQQILSGIKAVTDAASIQEDAVNRLNTALQLSGDFSTEASRDLQNFASELHQTTSIGDETTLGLLALAKSFNVSNEQAKNLVSAAADLSAQTGIELESAVRNLGKSLGGLSGELGESVAGIRDLTKEQLQAGGAIDLVANRFGGAAAAAANTYSGSIKGLQGSFGDLLEEIGFLITQNPVVIELVQTLSGAFRDLGKFISENADDIREGLNTALISVVRSAPSAVNALAGLAKILLEVVKGFNTLDGVISDTFSRILKGQGAVADGFKLLASPINSLVLGFTAVQKAAKEVELSFAKSEAENLKKEYEDLNETLRTVKPVGDGFVDTLTGLFKSTEQLAAENSVTVEELNRASAAYQAQSEEVARLQGEISLLDNIGQQAAIEIDIDGEKLADDLQVRVTEVQARAINLDETQQQIDQIASKLNQSLLAGADALEAAGNSVESTGKNVEQAGESLTEGAKGLGDLLLDIGVEFSKNILGGADGARKAVAGSLGAVSDFFLAGSGQFVAAFVDQIIQLGPEGVKQVIDEFVEALPIVIETLAEAMPVVAIAIAENADEIIIALTRAAPRIIEELVKAAPQIAVELIKSFGDLILGLGPELASVFRFWAVEIGQGLINKITEFNFAAEIGKGVSELGQVFSSLADRYDAFIAAIQDVIDGFKNVTSGSGPSKEGGLIEGTGTPLDFLATGGLVGGSGRGDSQLFALEPGELVVDRSTSGRLLDFVNRSEAGQRSDPNSDMVVQVLAQILAALQQPMQVETTAELDGQALVDILLTLNRTDARTTA